MSLFGFRKKKPHIKELNRLDSVKVSKVYGKESVVFKDSISVQNIEKLISILSHYNISFSFHDSLFPTVSDPGAYLDYSQEKNDKKGSWSMTLGNHGWTGGIYTLDDEIIAKQLFSLFNKKLLSSIKIEGASILSHYSKLNIKKNKDMVNKLEQVHCSDYLRNVDLLLFGHFISNSLSSYYIFSITRNKLLVDKTETWHLKRFSKDGYVSQGVELSNDVFLNFKYLLKQIPSEILINKGKGFRSKGKKTEDKLILGISGNKYGYSRQITIDNYENKTNTLPEHTRDFITLINRTIKELETAAANTQ